MRRKTSVVSWDNTEILPGDADKDAAVKRITRGHVDGRLSMEDMEARIDCVNKAGSVYELRIACRGLPEMQPRLPVLRISWQARWGAAIAGIPAGILTIVCGEIWNYTTSPSSPTGHALGALHAMAIPFIAIFGLCIAVICGVMALRIWDNNR